MPHRWTHAVVMVLVAGLLVAGSQGAAGQERDYFRVGVITSLSGELMYGGHVTRRGYDMWAETVNAQAAHRVPGVRRADHLYLPLRGSAVRGRGPGDVALPATPTY